MARRLLTHPLGSGVRAWGAAAIGRHGAATVRCLGCRSRAVARLQRLRRPCLQVHGPRLKSRSCRTAKGTGRRVSRATGSALPRGTGKVGIPTWLPISHTQPTNDDSASKRAQLDQKLGLARKFSSQSELDDCRLSAALTRSLARSAPSFAFLVRSTRSTIVKLRLAPSNFRAKGPMIVASHTPERCRFWSKALHSISAPL